VVAVWETFARLGWVPVLFLPSPLGVLREGWDMAVSGELGGHLVSSLKRLVLGFALGTGLGVTAGVWVGFFALAEAVGTPLIAATFPVPKIALLPLLILWLGIGEASKVAVIALGVFFPMAINTYSGVRQADPLLVRAAVAFGARRWSVIRKVILPSALPMIFAGLRLGAGTALLSWSPRDDRGGVGHRFSRAARRQHHGHDQADGRDRAAVAPRGAVELGLNAQAWPCPGGAAEPSHKALIQCHITRKELACRALPCSQLSPCSPCPREPWPRTRSRWAS
jgi:hypothetical protein